MEKIYKATMRALGGKPNGTGVTSCVEDAAHVKQLFMLLGLAFSLGALTFGFKGLPNRVKAVEEKIQTIQGEVAETKTISKSIDARLGRIEDALLNPRSRR